MGTTDEQRRAAATAALREAGARFAFVHGSRARGDHRPDSDLDVAAWWASRAPAPFDVLLRGSPPRGRSTSTS